MKNNNSWTEVGHTVDSYINLDALEKELKCVFGFDEEDGDRFFYCKKENGTQVELHEDLTITVRNNKGCFALPSWCQPAKRTLVQAAKMYANVTLDFLGVCGYKTDGRKEGYQCIILSNKPYDIRFNSRSKKNPSGNIFIDGRQYWFAWNKAKYPAAPFAYTKFNDNNMRERVGHALCMKIGAVVDAAL